VVVPWCQSARHHDRWVIAEVWLGSDPASPVSSVSPGAVPPTDPGLPPTGVVVTLAWTVVQPGLTATLVTSGMVAWLTVLGTVSCVWATGALAQFAPPEVVTGGRTGHCA
jgi:hypothetical protein